MQPRVRRPTARAEAEAADRASRRSPRTWASDDDKDIGFFRRADHETEFSAIARILNEQGSRGYSRREGTPAKKYSRTTMFVCAGCGLCSSTRTPRGEPAAVEVVCVRAQISFAHAPRARARARARKNTSTPAERHLPSLLPVPPPSESLLCGSTWKLDCGRDCERRPIGPARSPCPCCSGLGGYVDFGVGTLGYVHFVGTFGYVYWL